MDDCDCIGGQWSPDELLMRYQYVSDFFIALAYFSIPLELVYFVKKSAVFPYRWVLVQFGAFIVLCGSTHLINMWTFREHTRAVAMVMTVAKVLTAVVSCATALMLVHIIPDLLSVKTRELFLKNKAAELDREMGLIRSREETGRALRLLTHRIRKTLDREAILRSTLYELGRALRLEDCALWMPSRSEEEEEEGGLSPLGGGYGREGASEQLQLSLTLNQPSPPPLSVPLAHPTVKQVFSSSRAVVISPNSPVTVTGSGGGGGGAGLASPSSTSSSNRQQPSGDVVAVRITLLSGGSTAAAAGAGGGGGGVEWQDPRDRDRSYALLVLVLPAGSARRWHVHELEMVEVVADQVAVALSHAAILEDSHLARDRLMEQNVALDHARREAETAIRARNDFLAVMHHEMRTPMHAIIALSTLLQETELSQEQRSMVDTVLKSSTLLATLINDVLELSRLEDGSMAQDGRTFNVHQLFREVTSLVKPVASVKKLSLSLRLQSDVPEHLHGDDKRLMHTALNIVGNAVKFTREGSVMITVCLERPEFPRDKAFTKFAPSFKAGDRSVYLRVQVRDTGVGVKPEDVRKLFNKFVQADASTARNYGGSGLGLAISKRFVSLMGGHIWVESEGQGKGTTVFFVVRLGLPDSKAIEESKGGGAGAGAGKMGGPLGAKQGPGGAKAGVDFNGLKVLVCDDNHVNRMVTKRQVTRVGCEVTVVGSGRECLSALAGPDHGFKVLLLDLMMPDMDGYEVARRILDRFKTREADRPKIVALTANTDQGTKDRCMELGMDGVITKPISQEKMQTVFTELQQLGKL